MMQSAAENDAEYWMSSYQKTVVLDCFRLSWNFPRYHYQRDLPEPIHLRSEMISPIRGSEILKAINYETEA